MSLKDIIASGGGWAPPRLVLYGDEKVGKTSTVAQAPNPLYLGTDDGRRRLGVDGLPIPSTWDEFVGQLEQAVEEAPGLGYGSLVTDTLNGIVELCAEHVCQTQFGGKWNDTRHGFLAWGGNQGWGAVSEEIRRILPLYDQAIDASLWVVLIAHSSTQKVRNPIDGDYDRFAPAMDRRVWARVAQWADVIVRVDYDTTFLEEAGRRRAVTDGTRVLRCGATIADSVGCRVGYELPETIPFAWESIEEHLGKRTGEITERLRELWPLMTKDETKKAVAFLGVDLEELDKAPLHKCKSLINRLAEKQAEATPEAVNA